MPGLSVELQCIVILAAELRILGQTKKWYKQEYEIQTFARPLVLRFSLALI